MNELYNKIESNYEELKALYDDKLEFVRTWKEKHNEPVPENVMTSVLHLEGYLSALIEVSAMVRERKEVK